MGKDLAFFLGYISKSKVALLIENLGFVVGGECD